MGLHKTSEISTCLIYFDFEIKLNLIETRLHNDIGLSLIHRYRSVTAELIIKKTSVNAIEAFTIEGIA